MQGIENLFYRNVRLTVLTVLVICAAGLSAYLVLPRAEDPSLRRRFASLTTHYPGASAERVEALVTEKLEDKLREVEELAHIDSISRAGISILQIELDEDIDDIEGAWSRVRARLKTAEADLPPAAEDPELERQTVTAYTMITALVWEPAGEPQYAILRRMAEDLEDVFRGLAGTAEVDLFGDPEEEVRVEVAAADLAALNLTVAGVADAIRRADAKTPAGLLSHEASDLLVEVAGEVQSLERVLRIPVRVGEDGRTVRVGDVATVHKTVIDPPSELALVGGRPAVVVAARVEDAIRVDHWAEGAREAVAAFAARTPRGVAVETVFDQSRYVSARLDGLASNLLMGMALVMAVLLFMMGWRSALVISAALPLTCFMVLAGLRFLHVPLHQMSVMGLIVALGLLIDNAIVAVDEVRRRRQRGQPVAEAIGGAVRHLAIPLFGSTFTTALAFMPIVLMPGGAGEFVGTIGISVILAITSSLLLSLTVLPALCGLLKVQPGAAGRSRLWRDGFRSGRLTGAYAALVGTFLRRPLLGVGVALVLPLLGFWQASRLQEQFFPPADRDQFQVELLLPSHASLPYTLRTATAARDLLLEHPEVADVHWFLGTNAPKFYYNMFGSQEGTSSYAQALVQLRSNDEYFTVIRELQRRLSAALPDAQLIARQLEQGPPFDAPVELRLFGPDLDVLRTVGEELRGELAALPDVVHTRATLSDGRPKLWFRLDEESARLARLDNTAVAAHLRANLSGAVGGSLLEATEELPVRVRLAPTERQDVGAVESLDLVTAAATNGRTSRAYLPLAALGGFDLTPELSSVPRRDGLRVNTVQAFVQAGVLPSSVLDHLLARLEASGFEMPPGYRWEIAGESAERDTAVGNLMASVSVLVVLMAATLVLTFSSFRMAALLASVAGLSVGLGLAALALTGHPFGFMAIVGTMGLVGVALNDSIVVTAAIRSNPAARQGDVDAIRQVVLDATRHVLATTVTTISGFVPLLLAGGAFWPPLAIAIAGGVAGATLLALVLVPSAYVLLMCPRCPSRAREDATDPTGPRRLLAPPAPPARATA